MGTRKKRHQQRSRSADLEPSFHLRPWVLLVLIMLLALYLRLGFVPTASKIPFNFLSDSSQYFSWATHIVSGKEFIDVYHQSPLYPFFLAGIFAAFGPSIQRALTVQAILGTLCCLLVFWLSLKMFKRHWVGLASALMMAIYLPAIFYSGMLLMATLVTLLNLLFLVVLLKALEDDEIWMWAIAGIILGLNTLARATILLFVPFLMFFLTGRTWVEYGQEVRSRGITMIGLFWKRCLCPLSVVFLCAGLVVLPVTLRNYIRGRDLVLVAANAGITFYEGNNPWATGQYMDPPGLDLGEDFNGGKIAAYLENRDLRPSEISSFWFRESWKFIRGHPFQYVRLLGQKLAYFWNRYEIPNAENIYFARQYSQILRLPLLSFLLAGSLGVLGLIMALRRGVPHAMIVSFFLLSLMIANVLFFITARYRVPVTPILIVFASYFVLSMNREIWKRGMVTVLKWLSLGIVVFAFVSFPWKGLDPKNDYASSYDNIGILFHLTGDSERAIRYFRMAMEYDPTYVKAYNNMGAVYYAAGNEDEAMRYWKMGLAQDQQFPLIHLNLGNMYKEQGKLAMAFKAYRVAAAGMPYSIGIRKLGIASGIDQYEENARQ